MDMDGVFAARVLSVERLFAEAGLTARRIEQEFREGDAGWFLWDSGGHGPLRVAVAGVWLGQEDHDPAVDVAGVIDEVKDRLQAGNLNYSWVFDKSRPEDDYPVGSWAWEAR
jgi:hypothetical protein